MKKSLINNCFDIAINRMTGYSLGYSLEDCCSLYTDAFWKLQYEVYDEIYGKELKVEETVDYIEEIIACMLGGFGFKAEIGWSAYLKLKNLGLIKRGVGFSPLEEALSQPLKVGKEGRIGKDQGDRNFYTHFRHNIFPQKSLSMRSVR